MSEDTPFVQPQPSQPSPPPRASAGYRPPPYPPTYYQQPPQPPPARPAGCAQFFIHSIIAFVILAVLGIGILFGGFFLLSVATGVFDQIEIENEGKKVSEKFISGNHESDEKIAIITIEGMIISNEEGHIAKAIKQAMSDDQVRAVVLRVDSPGGTMTGSDYYLHLLKKMKAERDIPVVVSMGSIAASGGYYVSMVGDEIYAEPSTITGSIGVIASLFDASELLDKIGVKSTPITSGLHKAMGSISKPMSEEERAIWQHLIDDNFARFKKIIREGREEFADNPDELDKLATGQIYTANEAVENDLIDGIGFLDDAIERVAELADLRDDYKVIRYKPKLSVMETILESRAPNKLLNGQTWSEITTPRIYLLCPYVLPVHDGK